MILSQKIKELSVTCVIIIVFIILNIIQLIRPFLKMLVFELYKHFKFDDIEKSHGKYRKNISETKKFENIR